MQQENSLTRAEEEVLRLADRGLSPLGESTMQGINWHVEHGYSLKREVIPREPREFIRSLKAIFGTGSGKILEVVVGILFIEAMLMLSPVTSVAGSGGSMTNVVNTLPNTLFVCNSTLVTTGTARCNLLGVGGNDTFNLYGGNTTTVFAATGVLNNTFNVITGNPKTNDTGTFSLVSGDNSTFNIVQNNYNGTIAFSITAGSNSLVNVTSLAPTAAAYYSFNLGLGSAIDLGSILSGNQTAVNVVF